VIPLFPEVAEHIPEPDCFASIPIPPTELFAPFLVGGLRFEFGFSFGFGFGAGTPKFLFLLGVSLS
jgi:hypothetical protein